MNSPDHDYWGRYVRKALGRSKWPGNLVYFGVWGIWVGLMFYVGAWYLAIPILVLVVFFFRYHHSV